MGKNSSPHDLLMERFPKLGLLAPSFPSAQGKEEVLPPHNLEKVELLYIYGLGEGAAYKDLRKWLQGNPKRKLIFLEDEPGYIASFLNAKGATALLKDEQVFLELFEGDVQALAEKWPLRHVEIAPLPSRRGRRFQAIREKLLSKTALTHALRIDRLHGYQPFQNFVQNLRRLPESFYANGLKNAFQGVPAVVCGAGPSLEKAIPQLSQCEKRALLIAGGSTLAALSSRGIMPHFGMAIDPNLEEYRRFRNSFAFEVPLLYSTRVFPAIFQTCNGPFGYMRSGIGGAAELWIEEELGLTDPLLGEHLSDETISVTAICLAWAVHLGCNPIFLSGVDLAYTGNKRYAEGVDREELLLAELEAEKSAPDRIVKRKDRFGNPVHTAVRWLIEARGFSHFAKKHRNTQFFNTTEGGLRIRGIPYLSFEEAFHRFLQSKSNLRAKVAQQIASSPMPPQTREIISTKLQELTASLDRIIGFAEILAGEKEGSIVLAEFDLQEEYAFPYLFYDIDSLLEKKEKWKQFLSLAKKYRAVIDECCNPPRFQRS